MRARSPHSLQGGPPLSGPPLFLGKPPGRDIAWPEQTFCRFMPSMPFLQDYPTSPADASQAELRARLVDCAQECERLALSPRVPAGIAAAARECSHFCYMAAAVRSAESEHSSDFIFRTCMKHCAALASTCSGLSEREQCVRLCFECVALCSRHAGKTQLTTSGRVESSYSMSHS